MTTLEQVRADLVDAMRAKDELRLPVLRGIIAACTNELVAKSLKPTDVLDEKDVHTVVRRLVKQRKDSAEQFMKGNRPELAEREMKELGVLELYLPQMASEGDIEAAVREALSGQSFDPKKSGMIVGMVMKKLGGNADGVLVKNIIDRVLSE
jgi:uncharacterized protein YqeY